MASENEYDREWNRKNKEKRSLITKRLKIIEKYERFDNCQSIGKYNIMRQYVYLFCTLFEKQKNENFVPLHLLFKEELSYFQQNHQYEN
jgi:hypothetical protein